MSRVEKFPIPKNFPKSGVGSIKRMAARISRREEGRKRVVDESLVSSSRANLKKAPLRRERPRDDKKIEIIAQWPFGLGIIKRY